MPALPGGSADKLGNQYEDWWMLLRVADILTGKAARIRLEPPLLEGEGAEFWIDEQGTRWHEQAKDASAKGAWTVGRLVREGVLASAQRHLAASSEVRLVVSTTATTMAGLSERAAGSVSFDEFRGVLNDDQSRELPKVCAAGALTKRPRGGISSTCMLSTFPGTHCGDWCT